MAAGPAVETFRDSSSTQGDGKTATRSRVRNYTVALSDLINDTAEDAKLATGVPRYGDPHPQDFSLRCLRVDARRISPVLCEVEAGYEAPGAIDGQDPTNEPAQVEWEFADEETPIDEDVDGEPIATKAGEPFDPPLSVPFADLVLTVTRNNASFDPEQARQYMNVVNEDTFLVFPPGTCKISGIRSSSVFDSVSGSAYWKTTTVIRIRRRKTIWTLDEQAWWKRVRHEGYMCLDADGERVRCLDDKGEIAATPMTLMDDGTQEEDPAIGHFIQFQVFESKPFGPLNIL